MTLPSEYKRLTVIGASGAVKPLPPHTNWFADMTLDDLREIAGTHDPLSHQTYSVVLHQQEPASAFLKFLCRQIVAAPAPSEPALAWLPEVYAHVDRKDYEAAADMVFDAVDDLLTASEFRRCDELLQMVDVARLDTNLMICFLAATLPAKERLPSRIGLLRRIELGLEQLAPGRVEALLQTLR